MAKGFTVEAMRICTPIRCACCAEIKEWVSKQNPDTCIDCAMAIQRRLRRRAVA